jgi:hypothetical protein
MSQNIPRGLSIALLFISFASFAQKKSEMGFFAGSSYYLGDINPSRQFYSLIPSFGGLYRYSINPREVLRANVFYGSVKANDIDFSNLYQQNRKASFSASFIDASLLFEFNFLPVVFQPRKINLSPYTFVGIGYEIILSSSNNTGSHFAVPFGAGIKYVVNEKITVGTEWSFRKTFVDRIDGVINPGEQKYQSAINNKDWYSFAGFFITFRLFDKTGNCAVYQKK